MANKKRRSDDYRKKTRHKKTKGLFKSVVVSQEKKQPNTLEYSWGIQNASDGLPKVSFFTLPRVPVVKIKEENVPFKIVETKRNRESGVYGCMLHVASPAVLGTPKRYDICRLCTATTPKNKIRLLEPQTASNARSHIAAKANAGCLFHKLYLDTFCSTNEASRRKFAIAKCFAKDYLPFHLANSTDFREIFPPEARSFPSNNTLRNEISLIAACTRDAMQSALIDAKKYAEGIPFLHATTDIWTCDHTTNSYANLNVVFRLPNGKGDTTIERLSLGTAAIAHVHDAKGILESFNKQLLKYSMSSADIVSITTDSASNNQSAFKKMNWLGCMAHAIHNSVYYAMGQTTDGPNVNKEVFDLLKKVRQLVLHFTASPKRATNLAKFSSTSLKIDVATRWNSIYMMLVSVVHNKDALTEYFLKAEYEFGHMLTNSEYETILQLLGALHPIALATLYMEGRDAQLPPMLSFLQGTTDVLQQKSSDKYSLSWRDNQTKKRKAEDMSNGESEGSDEDSDDEDSDDEDSDDGQYWNEPENEGVMDENHDNNHKVCIPIGDTESDHPIKRQAVAEPVKHNWVLNAEHFGKVAEEDLDLGVRKFRELLHEQLSSRFFGGSQRLKEEAYENKMREYKIKLGTYKATVNAIFCEMEVAASQQQGDSDIYHDQISNLSPPKKPRKPKTDRTSCLDKPIVAACILLHPGLKNLKLSELQQKSGWDFLLKLLKNYNSSNNKSETTSLSVDLDEPSGAAAYFWPQRVPENQEETRRSGNESYFETEKSAYLALIASGKDKTCTISSKTFWDDHKEEFPILSKLGIILSDVMATSVESEREFSASGYMVNERRSNLKPEIVEDSMVIKKNPKYVPDFNTYAKWKKQKLSEQ